MFVAILAIREVLFTRVEERVKKSLVQEMNEFKRLVKEQNSTTGQLLESDVKDVFNIYLSRNVPDDDEFFLTLLNGKLYKYSPRAIPNSIKSNFELLKYWAQLTQPMQGEKLISSQTKLNLKRSSV